MRIPALALLMLTALLAEFAMAEQLSVCKHNVGELFRKDARGKFVTIQNGSSASDKQRRSEFWRKFEAHLITVSSKELPRCYAIIKRKYDTYEKGAKDCANSLKASQTGRPANYTDAMKANCHNQEVARTNFVDLRIRADNEIAKRINPKVQPVTKATFQLFCNAEVKSFYTNFLRTKCKNLVEKNSGHALAK